MEIRSKNSNKKINKKDMLLRASGKRPSLAASVTVEASIILPIFLFFFVNLLTIFDILKLQCDLEAALHQAGSQIMLEQAMVKHTLGNAADDNNLNAGIGAINSFTAGKKVKNYLGENYLNNSPISGGASGLKFVESAFYSSGDIIDIVATYKVHPLFGIAGFKEFPLEGRLYGHAFTGYELGGGQSDSDDEAEELVYITENGSAYHKSLDCSHLKLSVKKITKSGLSVKRNIGGAKYYPCEACGKGAGQTVYITNYGNRYHTKSSCSKIKRTIKTVPISEAVGKTPCKDCAG